MTRYRSGRRQRITRDVDGDTENAVLCSVAPSSVLRVPELTDARRCPLTPSPPVLACRDRPRLADRHARRREGPRGDLRALPRRARSTRWSASTARCRRRSSGTASKPPPCSGCRAPGASTATTCRSFRPPSSSSTSTVTISSSAAATARSSPSSVGPRHARLLLPLADALRLGSVPGVLRPRAGRGVPEPAAAARSWPRWPAGTPPRQAVWTAFSRTLNMLRGGSADTIIAGRPSCILLSIRSSTGPGRKRRDPARPPGFLVVSALVPYKRVEIAIEACRLAGCRLTIVGRGPEEARSAPAGGPRRRVPGLARATRRSATCTSGRRRSCCRASRISAWSRSRRRRAARRSSPSRAGGACETVVDGVTGVLVEDGSPAGFADGLRPGPDASFDPAAIRANAERFSRERFMTDFQTAVSDAIRRHGRPSHDAAVQPPARRLLRRQRRAARPWRRSSSPTSSASRS